MVGPQIPVGPAPWPVPGPAGEIVGEPVELLESAASAKSGESVDSVGSAAAYRSLEIGAPAELARSVDSAEPPGQFGAPVMSEMTETA